MHNPGEPAIQTVAKGAGLPVRSGTEAGSNFTKTIEFCGISHGFANRFSTLITLSDMM